MNCFSSSNLSWMAARSNLSLRPVRSLFMLLLTFSVFSGKWDYRCTSKCTSFGSFRKFTGSLRYSHQIRLRYCPHSTSLSFNLYFGWRYFPHLWLEWIYSKFISQQFHFFNHWVFFPPQSIKFCMTDFITISWSGTDGTWSNKLKDI